MQHITVYKGTEYHSAFPHIIRLQNGELVAVFRQAQVRQAADEAHVARPATSAIAGIVHHHGDPRSRIALVRSRNDGRTWDPSTLVVIDESDGSVDLNMAMVSQLPSGELLVNNHRWFMRKLTPEEAAEAARERLVIENPPFGSMVFDSLYFIRSSDLGYTWGKPQPIAFGAMAYRSHTGKHGCIQTADGTLLLPLNGYAADEKVDRVYLVRSRDGGRTWGQPSTVAHDPEQRVGFDEPPLLRLPSGRLLIVTRTSGADGYMYQAFSTDDGWTWQGLKRTPIWGYPCHLLRLRSGRILCAYGYRREPFGIRAALSEDDGETWDMEHEIVVRDDGINRDLGYPASVQLNDGRILTTYYFHGRDGVRYIGGSIYAEEEALK